MRWSGQAVGMGVAMLLSAEGVTLSNSEEDVQTDKAGAVLLLAVVDSQFAALVALVDAGGGFDRMLTHPVNGKVISEEETSPHVVGACMVVVGLPPDGETEYEAISEAESDVLVTLIDSRRLSEPAVPFEATF